LAIADETLFFEYAERQVLSRRLRHLSPQAAANLRDLFHGRECLVLDGHPATTWRFGPAPRLQPPAAILESAQEKLALSVTDDGWCEPLGARTWWDFTGEARLLAWALAHTGLLEGLGRILREPLMPSALTEGPLPHADTGVTLSFSAATADVRTTTGCVSMSATMLERLGSHGSWRRINTIPPALLKIPGTLRIELCGIAFSLGVLSACEVGDVLVLGNRGHCWRKMQVCLIARHTETPLRTWNASYDGAKLTVCSAAMNPPMELIMSDPKTGGAADIPVSLDFDLGNVAVPLGELATLKPGYVFELPGNLEGLRVAIRSNGTRIGQGELVAVGDVLGVQLLSLDVEGLR
jgi:type III secretion system YscQ/HrcQ family protein